jgi:hypothetical protein
MSENRAFSAKSLVHLLNAASFVSIAALPRCGSAILREKSLLLLPQLPSL